MAQKPSFLCLFTYIFIIKFAYSDDISYRLPLTVKPDAYSIQICPDLKADTFRGDVQIFVKVYQPVQQIILHSEDLTIEEADIDGKHEETCFNIDADLKTMNVFFKSSWINSGEHIIHIKYSGRFLNSTTGKEFGIRKAEYEVGDKKGYIVVSDFEPNHARSAFPCFDEPHFKAKFDVRIAVPNNIQELAIEGGKFIALSNMKLTNIVETSEAQIYDFQTSVPMSSYLITFIVTDYPYLEEIWDNDGVKTPIRLYSPLAKKEGNDVILPMVVKCLDYFTNYTNIKYSLPKLDLIEYERKSAGTEDWGMITLKTGLLCPSEKLFDEEVIGVVLCHEVSHFWFGNLVTNYWWNDIWIQEAFAQFLGEKAYLTAISDSLIQSYIYEVDGILISDATNESYPVSNAVKNKNHLDEVFSDITYLKGGAILRMVEDVLGEEKFRQALQKYLNTFAYKTATTHDVINCLEEAAPELPIREMLITWLFQRGYPLINIIESEDNKYWILKQTFFPTDDARKDYELSQKWTIPITFITDTNSIRRTVWFDKDMDHLIIPKENAKWIKFNLKSIGVYRVNYTDQLWKDLRTDVNKFEDQERALLFRELYELFLKDIVDCDKVLDLFEAMHHVSGYKGTLIYQTITEMFTLFYENEPKEIWESFVEYTIRKKHPSARFNVKDRVQQKIAALIKDYELYPHTPPTEADARRSHSCAKWVTEKIETNDVNVVRSR